jgi:DNA-directed RNA polymerase specialized sigma24 family protein
MEQRQTKWRGLAQSGQAEQLLASYYSQCLEWGMVLTRGDQGKAEDIVQEFCLYITLTKPDLSHVANMDGYLYTCLRHIYLSGLARASREALHFVSVAEFDSFEFAVAANQSGDPLQRQNDLRRICVYTAWRKESSKGASYFILHFFHGYSRREITDLARIPVSALYNKLGIARSEVKSYLEETGKLRIFNRDLPPEPVLSWSLLSSAELFQELRGLILEARTSECISEEELLSHYRALAPKPIACSLLAHIVSCERCLAIVDRYFGRPTLEDREPLDRDGIAAEVSNDRGSGANDRRQRSLLRSVRRRWELVHEHRPRTLSIAVNGKIIAFHDVKAEHSTLSARIEHPEDAQFVEVFSEQDVRLALLPIGDLPPEGSNTRTQRVMLSDARWLELNLTFDGLGLSSQVAYFDPALGIEALEDTEELAEPPKAIDSVRFPQGKFTPQNSWIRNALERFLRPRIPVSAAGWAVILILILGTAGYLAYRHGNVPSARDILNQSVKVEAADLLGQTEHQIVRLEEVSADGAVLQQGAVDLWKDGDGSRYVRRLYDSQHRLVTVKWRNKSGEHSSHRRQGDKDAPAPRHRLPMSDLWDQDLSAHAFSLLGGKTPQVHPVQDGYEVTIIGPVDGRPQLISATLTLDRRLLPMREIMRVQAGSEIHELRLTQAGYERKPSSSVPDTIFDPQSERLHSLEGLRSPMVQQGSLSVAIGTDLQLAQLQIAVLYQLNRLGADTGAPIEVVRTPEKHIRVSGAVLDNALRQEITSHLETLDGHQLLELRLISPRDVQVKNADADPATADSTSVYDVTQSKPIADATLRRYFQTKGLSGDSLDAAVGQYSHEALERAQRALQHAYALDRLGSALSATELKSVGVASQQQWAEMVQKHAADLEGEFDALHGKLAEILPPGERISPQGEQPVRIEDPAQFNRASSQLLRQTQSLNSDVGRLFTSNPSGGGQGAQDSQFAATMNSIPLQQAEEIAHFAVELKTSGRSALANQDNSEGHKGRLEPPR